MILEENNDKTDLNIIKANKNHIIQNMKAPQVRFTRKLKKLQDKSKSPRP